MRQGNVSRLQQTQLSKKCFTFSLIIRPYRSLLARTKCCQTLLYALDIPVMLIQTSYRTTWLVKPSIALSCFTASSWGMCKTSTAAFEHALKHHSKERRRLYAFPICVCAQPCSAKSCFEKDWHCCAAYPSHSQSRNSRLYSLKSDLLAEAALVIYCSSLMRTTAGAPGSALAWLRQALGSSPSKALAVMLFRLSVLVRYSWFSSTSVASSKGRSRLRNCKKGLSISVPNAAFKRNKQGKERLCFCFFRESLMRTIFFDEMLTFFRV